MSDEFGKFIQQAQVGERSESRFAGLETELGRQGGRKSPARYSYQCRVYTLFRPWQECHRCQRAFRPKKNAEGNWEDPEIVMPEDEDYVCPHNENDEYIELVNKIAREEVKLVRRGMDTLKTGVVQAMVEWGEPLRREQKEEPGGVPRL